MMTSFVSKKQYYRKDETNRKKSKHMLLKYLDWTAKQGRMITGNGKANEFYTVDRGFPFDESELPHYHCFKCTTGNNKTSSRDMIDRWRPFTSCRSIASSPLCGAWNRVLLEGGMEHSTEDDEIVWNLQSNTLFVDLRIPTAKSLFLSSLHKKESNVSSANPLQNCSLEELALFARQHVFSGFTVQQGLQHPNQGHNDHVLLCTRHHCIDWNYIGIPRSRPNKWYAEFSSDCNTFKEWSYATDYRNQSYYTETWKRSEQSYNNKELVVVSLRISSEDRHNNSTITDGIIVAIGDHFNYVIDRRPRDHSYFALTNGNGQQPANFVEYIDYAIQTEDRDKVISRLTSIDAGHGRIITTSSKQKQWLIDCALQPWKHSTALFHSTDENFTLIGAGCSNDVKDCQLVWDHIRWDIYESSLPTMLELSDYLGCGISPVRHDGDYNNSRL
jgi:hypothetical protein